MIEAIILNLERGVTLLQSLNDEQFKDRSVPPYYSSIGGHMRHILDIFDCIFDGLEYESIDLSRRKRNQDAEEQVSVALSYFNRIIRQLKTLQTADINRIVSVKDDLGLGMIETNYTLGALLIQAHSHAIHHFASLGYVLARLDIDPPDADFGYNPTTPRSENMSI